MFSMLDGEWDLNDVTQITFRKINFGQDPAQWTTACILRQAWTLIPPTPDFTDVGSVMRKIQWLSLEEREKLPLNPDMKTLHNPWRNEIHHLWNHLFYDIGNFLDGTYGMGKFYPPNEDLFGLEFPQPCGDEEGENVPVMTKVWETEVILLPTYLAPGVIVRVETFGLGEENGVPRNVVRLRGKFSNETEKLAQAWYIAKGLETRFYIQGGENPASDGWAAVIVYGKIVEESPRPSCD
ncbi:hypothetical protein EYB25_002591 [Talaromyces marneffei]|uniref:Uncharacterized protein n=2 Tax=Talaromyces marneffei TaxID=37727 RepID=B6QAR5_TALMQ|nr:hypothetical protein PMAA_064380 [Talaromyces marneffei ATCC 18224]KAE8554053.1 hypothetical protein EYB25_002591 [Talaromyces marneffei]